MITILNAKDHGGPFSVAVDNVTCDFCPWGEVEGADLVVYVGPSARSPKRESELTGKNLFLCRHHAEELKGKLQARLESK